MGAASGRTDLAILRTLRFFAVVGRAFAFPDILHHCVPQGRNDCSPARTTEVLPSYPPRLALRQGMLSSEFLLNFLPVGKDFTIPAADCLPVGNELPGSAAEVTRRPNLGP